MSFFFFLNPEILVKNPAVRLQRLIEAAMSLVSAPGHKMKVSKHKFILFKICTTATMTFCTFNLESLNVK